MGVTDVQQLGQEMQKEKVAEAEAKGVHSTTSPSRTPFFAIVFGGVAFDSIMELGVIHALMVTERKPPDYVLGISAGSISAVALGEILALQSNKEKVARFREFLNAYLEAPSDFFMGMLPEPSDTNTKAPLAPLQLPIHNQLEREDRERASRYLSGTIALLNDFASLRLTTRLISQISFRLLNLSAVENRLGRFKKLIGHLRHVFPLIGILLLNLWRFSPVGLKLLRALCNGKSVRHPKSTVSFLGVIPRLRKFLCILETLFGGAILYLLAAFAVVIVYPLYLLWRILKVTFFEALWRPVVSGVLSILSRMLKMWSPYFFRNIHDRFEYLNLKEIYRSLMCTDGITTKTFGRFLYKLLKLYDLNGQILNSYPIKQFIIRLFDPYYYGNLEMDEVWEHSFLQRVAVVKNGNQRTGGLPVSKKTLGTYRAKGIQIAIGVTDISRGETIFVPEDIPIVDGIKAAIAYPPFFHSEMIDNFPVIDAASVGEEPTLLLIDKIKKDPPSDEQAFICVYPVTTYPTETNLRVERFSGLVDRIQRAMDLQRMRQSRMEYQSVRNHTRLLPTTKGIYKFGNDDKEHVFIGADVFPIEADQPLRLTGQLIASSDRNQQEEIVLSGIAAGCRATLQRLFQPEISELAGSRPTIKCKSLFANKLGIAFLGSESSAGGGVLEVCKHCSVTSPGLDKTASQSFQSLTAIQQTDVGAPPIWPKCGQPPPPYHGAIITSPVSESPLSSDEKNKTRVSLLLSGGVFRGVYQVGVLCGLNEAGVRPRLMAGSSVGAIIAAMGASLSLKGHDMARQHLCSTAATFLSLDQIILTDRFADFVRRLIIRADEVDLSFKDLDDILRRFDKQSHAGFNNKVRRILGGIERLFAISPFELIDLIREFRNGNDPRAWAFVKEYMNYFLDRNEVGREILGSEPLRLLICEHVLNGMDGLGTDFSYFSKNKENPIDLLATTTDLCNGKLEVIGLTENGTKGNALLVEALLASSAFPGVFRSRRSSEVFPQNSEPTTEYVDGGLMDNLPIEAVVKFLKKMSHKGELDCRPKVPHLFLIAPLEPDYQKFDLNIKNDKNSLEELKENWILLKNRVNQLRYNRKINMFMRVEENFQLIIQSSGLWDTKKQWAPLNLKILPITPKWLCPTFGFNSMLGFRHDRQAANIAHGCATTLITLGQVCGSDGDKRGSWGISVVLREDLLNSENNPMTGLKDIDVTKLDQLRRSHDSPAKTGTCWFRKNERCPFSQQVLHTMNDTQFHTQTKTMLNLIYLQCGMAETHRSHKSPFEASRQNG